MSYLTCAVLLCDATALLVWRNRPAMMGWIALASFLSVGVDISAHIWFLVPLNAVTGIICAIIWWRGRRDKRKRAASLIGEKSRALRDSLVQRMAEEGAQ